MSSTNPEKKVRVTCSWDDGHRNDVRLAEMLRKHKAKGTFFIYPENYVLYTKDPEAGMDAEAFAQFQESYFWLLDSVLERKPETKILLLEPFLLEVDMVTPYWREHLSNRRKASARIAGERGLPLVPLQEIFDDACRRAPAAYWAYDGIHPTHSGARLIADAWLQAAETHALLC